MRTIALSFLLSFCIAIPHNITRASTLWDQPSDNIICLAFFSIPAAASAATYLLTYQRAKQEAQELISNPPSATQPLPEYYSQKALRKSIFYGATAMLGCATGILFAHDIIGKAA